MEIIVQELSFSEYNHALYIKNKTIEINDSDIACLMITQKDNITKNSTNLGSVEVKKVNNKNCIAYKDFKVFYKDGKYINFAIYEDKELEKVMKKFRKITNNIKPLLFDNFIEESPLLFNSENYCYVEKENIKKVILKNGHKDLGNEFYKETEIPNLILNQEVEGCINFKILELDLGFRKIKLNMYLQKTLEHNEVYAPGLITVKQKIKKML